MLAGLRRILLACFAAGALPAVAGAQTAREQWYHVYAGERILVGSQYEGEIPTAEGLERSRTREMAYSIDGHSPMRSTLSVRRQIDRAGRTFHITIESLENGQRRKIDILVANGQATIMRFARGAISTRQVALPQGLDFADSESLFDLQAGGMASQRYLEVDPDSGDIAETELRREPPPADAPGDLPFVAYRDGLPFHVWLARLDNEGRLFHVVQPLLGSRLTLERVNYSVAIERLSAKRPVPHPMVPSPYTIAPAALAGHIRYSFGLRAAAGVTIPTTGEQAVQPIDGGYQLDICADCGGGLSTDPDDLARWRRPTAWLQSDARELRDAAGKIAASPVPERSKMKALGRLARARLAGVDYDGHYSALDAWRRRSGDCTEDAVLLAALARAAGIPARVANGTVYSRKRYHGAENAFVAHSWVVAYVDGRWKCFDISEGSFDASHVALTIGDGDATTIISANQIAALLEWRAMTEVRTRPAS